jgi:hypothetical protein
LAVPVDSVSERALTFFPEATKNETGTIGSAASMNGPAQGGMAGSVDEHLAFDIGFALPRSPIKGLRRALTEDERRVMAKAIVEHLRLCGWEYRLGPERSGMAPDEAARHVRARYSGF